MDTSRGLRVLTPKEVSSVSGGRVSYGGQCVAGVSVSEGGHVSVGVGCSGNVGPAPGCVGYNSDRGWNASVGNHTSGTNGSCRGGGSDGGSRGRVICTHFYSKGMIDRDVWRADLEYTATHISEKAVRGYQYWAIPYVRLMRRSPVAEKLMYPLMLWRAEELAYRMGKRKKGNSKGKLLRLIAEPICYAIGCCVGAQNWSALWTEKEEATNA